MASYIRQFLAATSAAVTLGTSIAHAQPVEPRTLRYTEQCDLLKSSPTIQIFDKARKPEAFAQDSRVGCRFGLNGEFKNLLEVYPLNIPARAEDFQSDLAKARAANAAGGDKKAETAAPAAPSNARQEAIEARQAKRAERALKYQGN